eukprot:scaffold82909_cov35-Attheya_sp.AAC.1
MHKHMGLKLPANPYVAHLMEINTPASMKPCCKLTGVIYKGFPRSLRDQQDEDTGNDSFLFQLANMQYMLFRMMTYIEKAYCARVKVYYDSLVLHHKAIREGNLTTETITAQGGREMPRRLAKESLALDKEIALVDNWGWKGRPNPKPLSSYEAKERWGQSEVREAVSMFADLRFQSTWQSIEYVVPSLRGQMRIQFQ